MPYKDKTPITKEYLLKRGFEELGTSSYLLSWGYILELKAELKDEETCMACSTICQALVEAGIIKEIGY